MKELFASLIMEKSAAGTSIQFFQSREGDKKKTLLTHTPRVAARTLKNKIGSIVAIVPDLYPPNKGFPHRTYDELRTGAEAVFIRECGRIASGSENELLARFKVFCFKHDLEVLLLASPEALKNHLRTESLKINWTSPAENQNHDVPPKTRRKKTLHRARRVLRRDRRRPAHSLQLRTTTH